MSFTGKWKRTGSENALAILSKMGMPKEMIEGLKSVETFIEIKQEGDSIDEVHTVGTKVTHTVFKIGEKTQITTWNDDKVDVVPVAVGPNKHKVEFDHLGVHQSGVRELVSETEFVDHVDMDNGAVVGKFIYTKC